jgi:uncharacterized protein (TIGR03067 family)
VNAGCDQLEGVWLPRAANISGKVLAPERLRVARLVIGALVYRILDHVDHVVDSGQWQRNHAVASNGLDLIGVTGPHAGKRIEALFELTGDSLLICYDLENSARPLHLTPAPEQLLLTITYAREPLCSVAGGVVVAPA